MSATTESESHMEQAGNHGDVLKHVTLCAAIKELREVHSDNGLLVVDTHCGPGLYDLGLQKSLEYEKGILRVAQNVDESPKEVQFYFDIVQAADSYLQNYPGSPVFVERLLRRQDEHRLCDRYVDEVQGLLTKNHVLEQGDAFHPEAIDFFLPDDSTKHPVIIIDPSYKEDEDFTRALNLMEQILDKNPYATIFLWYPLIGGNRHRFTFGKELKDLVKEKAKVGYYHNWVTVQKDGMQGSSVFIINPTKLFDEVIGEEVLDWMSAILLKSGKSEFFLDQWMKKTKTKAVTHTVPGVRKVPASMQQKKLPPGVRKVTGPAKK